MAGGCGMVAVAIPEFDVESAFDGTLADRWERELRGREASAGMLCLFPCSVLGLFEIQYKNIKNENFLKVQNPTKKKIFIFRKFFKKYSLSFHVASQ